MGSATRARPSITNSTPSTATLAMQVEIRGRLSCVRRDAISIVPSDSQMTFFNSAAQTYQEALASNATALGYLRRRGLSADSARSFRLGVVVRPLTGHEQYQGRLAIPYLTRAGVAGITFRCMSDHDCKAEKCPKYLWPSGVERRMFNTSALDAMSDVIAVCEGEIDTITAAQCVLPAVGIPGVDNWEGFWAMPLRGYETVYILADGDSAKKRKSCTKCRNAGFDDCQGHKAGSELAMKIEAALPQARTILMPEGHDVNSFVLEHGQDALRARIGA